MRNRQRGSNLALLMLASQVFQVGLDNIPPVTLATLGLNVYLYLFPMKPLLQACVSVQQAYWQGDWRRLLFSPLHHVDDWHLYFNMTSFLWKGIRLERRLGGAWFAYLLSVFSLLTGLVYLLLEAGLTELMDDSSYSMQCAVGFSGVLFGLKVVNNHYNPGGVNYIMGLPVANRYACWAELILIHIMNPGTSFVGHLAGILVGLLYTAGPLRSLMKTCAGFLTASGSSRTYYQNSGGPSGSSRTYYQNSGYSGYGVQRPPAGVGSSRAPPSAPPSAPPQHPYAAGLSEEEQLTAAVRASLNEQGGATPQGRPWTEPNAEELRRRRLQRFDR